MHLLATPCMMLMYVRLATCDLAGIHRRHLTGHGSLNTRWRCRRWSHEPTLVGAPRSCRARRCGAPPTGNRNDSKHFKHRGTRPTEESANRRTIHGPKHNRRGLSPVTQT